MGMDTKMGAVPSKPMSLDCVASHAGGAAVRAGKRLFDGLPQGEAWTHASSDHQMRRAACAGQSVLGPGSAGVGGAAMCPGQLAAAAPCRARSADMAEAIKDDHR